MTVEQIIENRKTEVGPVVMTETDYSAYQCCQRLMRRFKDLQNWYEHFGEGKWIYMDSLNVSGVYIPTTSSYYNEVKILYTGVLVYRVFEKDHDPLKDTKERAERLLHELQLKEKEMREYKRHPGRPKKKEADTGSDK